MKLLLLHLASSLILWLVLSLNRLLRACLTCILWLLGRELLRMILT